MEGEAYNKLNSEKIMPTLRERIWRSENMLFWYICKY